MLAKKLNEYSTMNIKDNVLRFLSDIKIEDERIKLHDTIFKKQSVCYLPYQLDWVILAKYNDTTDALMYLSGVTIKLNLLKLNDTYSVITRDYIIYIFKTLRCGLIKYGCQKPPFIEICLLNEDEILNLSSQVLKFNLKKVSSMENMFLMDSF